MPERSTVSTVFQLGVEAMPGTLVAANRLLPNLQLEPDIKTEVDQIAPQGFIFDTYDILNREWTEAAYKGYPTYESLPYLLCGLIANVAPVVSGTTGQKWTNVPTSTGGDAVKTYTFESGSAVRAGRFGYGLINSLKLKWGRSSRPEVSGMVLAGQYQDGITMTAAPTNVGLTPITPGSIDLFLDATSGGLGTSKLPKVREAELEISGRWSPTWYLNSANASFGGNSEVKPKATLKIKAAADATSMAWLTTLRTGATVFARIQATGPQIGVGPAVNSLKWDFALQVEKPEKFGDDDGLYAINWNFSAVHNAGWGKAMSLETINSIATL